MNLNAIQKLYLNSNKAPGEKAVYYKRWYSYAEITTLVNMTAVFLIQNGYKENQNIALYFDPCIEALILSYACLQIGAYYVPLNSTQNLNTLREIIDDLDNKKIICLEKDAHLFSSSLSFNIDKLVEVKPALNFSPGKYAYQLFTSGTTGKPKAIRISTDNLNYFTAAMDLCFPCSSTDTLLWSTTWTFDVSIVQLFGFLSNKGKLIIPETNLIRTHSLIPQLVKDFSITHLNLAPTVLSQLLKVWTADDLKILNQNLKYLLLAGEKLTKELALRTKRILPDCKVLNLYGPTETTVYASYYEVTGNESLDIPIGKALPGCEIQILTEKMTKAAVSEEGELFIGGNGVCDGYVNNQFLTNQSFLEIENKKYYKTGDYGKLNPSGDIEYLYRKDRQIKIHGMRLELSEIENKLSTFFNLPQQVHALFDGKQLHIFYIGDKSLQQKLSEHLKTNLPNYAQPSSFNCLSEFPTNASGKLDEKALYAILKK